MERSRPAVVPRNCFQKVIAQLNKLLKKKHWFHKTIAEFVDKMGCCGRRLFMYPVRLSKNFTRESSTRKARTISFSANDFTAEGKCCVRTDKEWVLPWGQFYKFNFKIHLLDRLRFLTEGAYTALGNNRGSNHCGNVCYIAEYRIPTVLYTGESCLETPIDRKVRIVRTITNRPASIGFLTCITFIFQDTVRSISN